MTNNLLKNIDSIPSLPESVQEVERIYRDSDSTFEDMKNAIEKDPFLTANILRIVNSPFYVMKSKITSLQQAIALLGKDAIRTFVLSSTIDSNFEIDLTPYSITPEEFRTACEKQMALIIHWLKQSDASKIALLAPAAFLVDIGRLVIAKTLIEEGNSALLQGALSAGVDITKAEKEVCGAQTTDVTASLFHNWNLDPDIIHIIRYSDDPEGTYEGEKEMAAQLKAVRETVLFDGSVTEASIANAKETIEEFGLDLASYENALERVLNA